MDNSNVEKSEEIIKKKVGRPRFDPDVVRTSQPDYWRNHYHLKRTALVECPNCNQMVSKNNLSPHKKTMKCRLRMLEKQNE
jgi:ribosomal protein L32|tara:strand:+ start:76 stop:318 length:243 start_codon:yes stop_codon:yes gene_type:complete